MHPQTHALTGRVALGFGLLVLAAVLGGCLDVALGLEALPPAEEAISSASDLDYTPMPENYTPLRAVELRLKKADGELIQKAVAYPQPIQKPAAVVCTAQTCDAPACAVPIAAPVAACSSGACGFTSRPRLFWRRCR